MRSLKYAILGLLNRRPMTGYELSKEFNDELAEFWYANHSQIYPELKKLNTEGLVTFDVEISGEVLESKRYTITESGQRDLLDWLGQCDSLPKTPKDVFRLRLYFSNILDMPSRIQLLENQKKAHKKRLSALRQNISQYSDIPPASSDRFGDFLVLRGAILREESTLIWIDECLNYCQDSKD